MKKEGVMILFSVNTKTINRKYNGSFSSKGEEQEQQYSKPAIESLAPLLFHKLSLSGQKSFSNKG